MGDAAFAVCRVSATGRRFAIDDTVLWTVRDAAGVIHGKDRLLIPDCGGKSGPDQGPAR